MITAKQETSLLRYIRAALTATDSSVLETLSNMEVPGPYKMRVKVLYSPQSPLLVFESLAESGYVERIGEATQSFSYTTSVGRIEKRKVSCLFHIASFPGCGSEHVGALISVCRRNQWEVLQQFTKAHYPRLVPVLLSQTELIESARSLKAATAHGVRVRSFSAKETVAEGARKSRKSVREWTDEDLDRALVSIQERGQVVTALDVEFYPKLGDVTHILPSSRCNIRKSGELEVSGSFDIAFEAVASELAKVGKKKLEFYSGRGLRETSYKPRPISISFRTPVLGDKESIRNLVAALAMYPHSVHSVKHGNPYGHVKLADLYDGSSFDVWAMPPHRLALVPGLKASEAAVERLVHFIFDKFREGTIGEYGRRPG